MSAAISAPAHAMPRPARATREPVLRVRRIGFVILLAQLAGFLTWSAVLYSHFAQTPDFAQYHQAWYLIAHGNLDPHDTLGRFQFWQNHSEFMLWPLSVLYWVWPHAVDLLWLQDIGVIVAEIVAFTWICQIARERRPARQAAWLAGAGLALLVVNPWILWGISFDFHFETIGIPFAALLAWDLSNGRRRTWLWVLPLLACGDVTGTYLAGIGLGAVLAGREHRRQGIALACVGIMAVLFETIIHGNMGSAHGLQAYAYLAVPGAKATGHLPLTLLVTGIATHPLRVLGMLWDKRIDLWANLAPSGLLGLGFQRLLPLVLIIVLENNLFHGYLFAEPLFQSLPIYIFSPIATVAVLCWLLKRRRWVGVTAAALILAQAAGWAAVWGLRASTQWLRVSTPAAATLSRVAALIPDSAEVISSQGVIGRFAGRLDVRAMLGSGWQPIDSRDVWFVISPYQGIQTQSSGSAMALVAYLSGPLHATMVADSNGVWAFHWHPPTGVHRLLIPGLAPIPAWITPGASGRAVLTGPLTNWRFVSTGRPGYLVSGLAWQVKPNVYQATVTLSATGSVRIEVWDDTGNVLLARRTVPATDGVQSISFPVNATGRYHEHIYTGWGPFRAKFVAPPTGQRIEIRIVTSAGSTASVYRASLIAESNVPRATQ